MGQELAGQSPGLWESGRQECQWPPFLPPPSRGEGRGGGGIVFGDRRSAGFPAHLGDHLPRRAGCRLSLFWREALSCRSLLNNSNLKTRNSTAIQVDRGARVWD